MQQARPTSIAKSASGWAIALLVCVVPAVLWGEAQHGHHDHHAGHGQRADDPHAHHAPPARPESSVERSEARYEIPKATLLDQEGREVRFDEMLARDEPVLLNFIFTTCTAICPPMSATFARLQKELGSDREQILMISVSIDPEHDRPAQLASYAKRFEAGSQWRFLTGSLEDSIDVQKAFDAYRGDKMYHAPLTLMRPAPDSPWVRYDGFVTAAELADASRAAIEARQAGDAS